MPVQLDGSFNARSRSLAYMYWPDPQSDTALSTPELPGAALRVAATVGVMMPATRSTAAMLAS